MIPNETCRLCLSHDTILIFKNSKAKEFYQCRHCGYTQVNRLSFASLEDENKRYQFHNNDVESEGYQNYLMPIVDQVLSFQQHANRGLDYGSGPSSVVEYLLKKSNYQIQCYDPLFYNHPQILTQSYDYVVCTEVFEHFKDPISELIKILNLLKPLGRLYVKTELTDDVLDFSKWHYHRDFTHVGFFSQNSFRFLETRLSLQIIKLDSQFIIYQKTS